MAKSNFMEPKGLLALAIFLIPLLLAFMPEFAATGMMILVLLGVIFGIISVSVKERLGFLVAVLVLAGLSVGIGAFLPAVGFDLGFVTTYFLNLSAALAPAAIIVAFVTVWETARNK